jgi:hypothetical protein
VTEHRPPPRLGDTLFGISAALLIFAAVPAVLACLVGLPHPRHLDRADLLSLHAAFDLLAAASWVAWAGSSLALAHSVWRRVARRDTTAGARATAWEHLAARIAAAVLVLGTTFGTAAVAGASPTAPATSPTPAALVVSPPTPQPPPAVSAESVLPVS